MLRISHPQVHTTMTLVILSGVTIVSLYAHTRALRQQYTYELALSRIQGDARMYCMRTDAGDSVLSSAYQNPHANPVNKGCVT